MGQIERYRKERAIGRLNRSIREVPPRGMINFMAVMLTHGASTRFEITTAGSAARTRQAWRTALNRIARVCKQSDRYSSMLIRSPYVSGSLAVNFDAAVLALMFPALYAPSGSIRAKIFSFAGRTYRRARRLTRRDVNAFAERRTTELADLTHSLRTSSLRLEA